MNEYMEERNKLIKLVTAKLRGEVIEFYDEKSGEWNVITNPYFDCKNLDYYRIKSKIQPYPDINAFAHAITVHGPGIIITDGTNKVGCIPDIFDTESCRIMDSFVKYTELTDSNKYRWIDGIPCGIEQ